MHVYPTVPELSLRTADGRTFQFSRSFHVGRSEACDVPIDDHHISRKHLLVAWNGRQWTFTDLDSSNGVFARGTRVHSGVIDGRCTLNLGGVDGPMVSMDVDLVEPTIVIRAPIPTPAIPSRPTVPEHPQDVAQKYFGASAPDESVGEHTRMIRKAYAQVQKQQKRRYGGVVAGLAVVVLLAGAYALHANWKMREQEGIVEDLFYQMKALDVDIAQAEIKFGASGSPEAQGFLRDWRDRRRQMEESYDRFLTGLRVHGRPLTEEERLIMRVTRRFGECELIAPREYLAEVTRFIRRWQSTQRFTRGVQAAQQRRYVETIARAFIEQDLPPHYFYLALQESNFDPRAVGTPTRYGYAKGMWQFIPGTGKEYGLVIGPRANVASYDPEDERFDWEKATFAAARYIKKIYATDAQASGLLVMASYNWGEGRVIARIRQMPPNPRDRNFWKLLAEYRIPDETYNYVFSIVSAAVIGENPRLFGFPFDDPLGGSTPATTAVASAGRVAADGGVSAGLP